MLKLQGYRWPNCSPILEVSNSLQYPEEYGQPVLKAFDCKDSKRDNNNNEGGGNGCLYILATEDDSILAIQKSRIRWVRDEALANVVASEFIDLPVVDDEGALENEIKSKTTGKFLIKGAEGGRSHQIILKILFKLFQIVFEFTFLSVSSV